MFNSYNLFSPTVSKGQEFGQWGRADDLFLLHDVWDLSWKTQKLGGGLSLKGLFGHMSAGRC